MKPILTLTILLASTISAFAAPITIDTVFVGDAGNPNDPATGNLYGGVPTNFDIGKYEVTVGQYTEFLNAVATTDTYGLYDTLMATNLNIAGIARSGASGSYSYSVIGSANHPVTYVTWGDAVRFANWLGNGQPTGAQDATTTEDGSYTLNGATSQAALMAVVRNANAVWVLPTENEWYKAAYYQPTAAGGDADGYWQYPMKTNSAPYSDNPPGVTPDNTRVGNFFYNDGVANGYDNGFAVTGSPSYSTSTNYLTDVGAYTSSPSYYGTFDQGGSMFEVSETAVNAFDRGLRGGSWGNYGNADNLRAANRSQFNPTSSNEDTGFRVARIPEPSTAILVGFATFVAFARGCLGGRRR